MRIEGKADAAFFCETGNGCISVVIKEKGTKNYYLREKTDIICFSSDQAEYLALQRLIMRVLHLQRFNIIPKDVEIWLYSDNKVVVDTIINCRVVPDMYKDIVNAILVQYGLLAENHNFNLGWVKRTKNKEAHRYLYNKKYAGRKLMEIIPEQLKFDF